MVKNKTQLQKLFFLLLVIVIVAIISLVASFFYDKILEIKNSIDLRKLESELSTPLTENLLLSPAQENLPNASRIVMVHNKNAANWYGSSISGTDFWNHINQTEVDKMVYRGLKELTGKTTIQEAWRTIIPNYQPHQKIAIKVNNNNVISSGSTCTSDVLNRIDSNSIDSNPIVEPINSIIKSLKETFEDNISNSDIWIYESRRCYYYNFMQGITNLYPGVMFYSSHEGMASVPGITMTGFSGTQPSSTVTLRTNGQTFALNDALVNADYLVDFPIVRKHGYDSATLSFKNHYGSIDPNFLNYHELRFSRTNNILVDIYNNSNIKDKTVLVLGDAIIGSSGVNYLPPSTWTTRFTSEYTPEMLFFAADPVAADSVMADLLLYEKGSEDVLNTRNYMLEAQDFGLGVAEIGTWSASGPAIDYPNVTITYNNIDFVQVNLDTEICGDGTCNEGEACSLDCMSEVYCDDNADNDADNFIDCDDNDCNVNEICELRIDSMSGTFIHKQNLTLNGANFGVKIGPRGDATPLFFDDFETNPLTGKVPVEGENVPTVCRDVFNSTCGSGNNMNTAYSYSTNTYKNMWTGGFTYPAKYSSTNLPPNSASNFASIHRFAEGGTNGESNIWVGTNENTQKIFVSFWGYYEITDLSWQMKFWRIEESRVTDGKLKLTSLYFYHDADGWEHNSYGYLSDGGPNLARGIPAAMTPLNPSWYQTKYQARQSDLGVANGTIEIWHSHTNGTGGSISKVIDWQGIVTRVVSQYADRLVIGETALSNGIPTAPTHFDDVYFDNSWARIELCDNETWNNRRKCEMQIPQTWQDNSITFTANQGTFTNGSTAYLYVVDENGNVSSGYQITISGQELQPSQCQINNAYWEY